MTADDDALAGVRARVDDAYAAADRLVREAEQAARSAVGAVPPNGWDVAAEQRPADRFPDLTSLLALFDAVRHALPPELAQQMATALRELLLALRALLDWWIERLDGAGGGGAAEVEDIPID